MQSSLNLAAKWQTKDVTHFSCYTSGNGGHVMEETSQCIRIRGLLRWLNNYGNMDFVQPLARAADLTRVMALLIKLMGINWGRLVNSAK